MFNVRMKGLHGIKNLGSVVLAWEDLIYSSGIWYSLRAPKP